MKLTTSPFFACCVLAAATTPAVYAQSAADSLPAPLRACARETDVMRRLSCYDREMLALEQTPAADVAAATADGSAAKPSSSAVPAPESAPESGAEPPPSSPAPMVASGVAIAAGIAESMPPPAAVAEATNAEIAAAAAPSPPSSAAPAPESAPESVTEPAPLSPAPTVASGVAASAASAASKPPSAAVPEASKVDNAPAATAVAEKTPDEDFGRPDEGPAEISATVTDIHKRPYGELVIRLDNGQTWEQKHRDNRFRLKIGDQVTISRGLISGYRLTGRNNNSIQVERRQ